MSKLPHDTKNADDLFDGRQINSLEDLAFSLNESKEEKIRRLEKENAELHRILALQNEDKYSSKSKETKNKLAIEEMSLEAFSVDGNLFNKVMVSKHADSDFVNITFVPNEGKVLQINLTEKSYMKFWEVIDVFKLKSINTRQFEEN